jgi:Protein of unknown function (DUF3276).
MQAKPLHTELIRSGNRSFFFDIKQSEKGNAYLTINITQKQEDGTYNRDKITIFENEMVKFGEGMMRAMINFRQTGREAIIETAREKYPNAFSPWTKTEDKTLTDLYVKEVEIIEISQQLGRNENGIKARIEKLKLDPKYATPTV